MIFVEYIEPERAIPLEIFRHHIRQDWVAEGDVMIANIGRTMRMAEEPLYMCWWQIHGVARMDEWEAHFRSPEGRLYAAGTPVPRAMRFTRCGLYDEIVDTGVLGSGLHLLEQFTPGAMTNEAIDSAFAARAAAAPEARLAHVIRRLGLLGADPGGMALWTFESYAAAEPFLRATLPAGGPEIVSAGLYRNVGEEII